MNKIKFKISENEEIVRFVKILGIVIICVLAVYIFTRVFVTRDLFRRDDFSEEVRIPNIDYSVTTLGALLNRPYDEYYVFAFDSTEVRAGLFRTIMNMYREHEDTIKLYHADLNSPFNSMFLADESNFTPNSVADLKLSDATLIKVRNGRIVRFIETKDEIIEELSVD